MYFQISHPIKKVTFHVIFDIQKKKKKMSDEPVCSICYGSIDTYCYKYKDGNVSVHNDPLQLRKIPSYFTYSEKRQWGNFVIAANYNKMIHNINEYLENPNKKCTLKYNFIDNQNNVQEGIFNIIQVLAFILNDICKWNDLNANKIVYVIPFSWIDETEGEKGVKQIKGKYALEVISNAAKIANKEIYFIDTLTTSVFDFLVRSEIKNETDAIFIDFGDTHFDIAIVKLKPSYQFDIIYKSSDQSINGKDLTFSLMKVVINKLITKKLTNDAKNILSKFKELVEKEPVDILDNYDFYNFYLAIRKLKEDLSSSAQILFQPITVNHGEEMEIIIQRKDFEECEAMINIQKSIKAILQSSNISNAVSKQPIISLQGGSSRIPSIRELIANHFGLEGNISMIINSVECFSEGAAYYYSNYVDDPKSYSFIDISKYGLSEMSSEEETEMRKRQEQIDSFENKDIMIAEIKNAYMEYYFKLLKLFKSPIFKEYSEEQKEDINNLLEEYEFVKDDIDEKFKGRGYEEIHASFSELKLEVKEITGDDNINLRRKPKISKPQRSKKTIDPTSNQLPEKQASIEESKSNIDKNSNLNFEKESVNDTHIEKESVKISRNSDITYATKENEDVLHIETSNNQNTKTDTNENNDIKVEERKSSSCCLLF